MSVSGLSARLLRYFNIPTQLYKTSKPPLWQKPLLDTTALKMSSAIGGTGFGSAVLYAVVTSPAQELPKPKDAHEKAHHAKNGNGYVNPWDSYVHYTLWGFFSMTLRRQLQGLSRTPDTTPPPIVTPSFLPTRDTPNLRATWLGHACYYVEFPSGLRVLFDPVFEDCCAPVALKHLRRYTPPACEIEDLPAVDLVVISHNHYDHLSYPSIKRIQAKFPGAHFFAPLGNKTWFEKSGVSNVTELDWWESRDVRLEVSKGGEEAASRKERKDSIGTQGMEKKSNEGVGITATVGALPCQHVTARGAFDKNKTLWASWSIESGGAKVWFAGDTGYRAVPRVPTGHDDYSPTYSHLPHCPAFAQIGALRGPFDLGLIPIGAYAPREIHSSTHASPKDAVNIFVDTRCRRALAMHWGTWVLTEEDALEPPRLLKKALEEKGVDGEGVFDVLDVGGSMGFAREG